MDPRLLRYYERELQFVREMGAEYAEEYPKIAARLGLSGLECTDPYVERLLEGFAFLAARVQLKLDAEFPRLTQNVLETVCPQYLAPTPSMAVVQLQPKATEGSLASGFPVKRDTALKSPRGKGDEASCEYRTAHDVRLWPLEIAQASYAPYSRELGGDDPSGSKPVRSAVRLRLRALAGLTFDRLPMDSLVLYLRGVGDAGARLYEQIVGGAVGVLVRSTQNPSLRERLEAACVRRVGFDDEQALLPYGRRSFRGYRLLHEYFALPERFHFVEVCGLARALPRFKEQEIEIAILLQRDDPTLHNVVDASNFALHCTPAINVFPMQGETIHLSDRKYEYHVVPDRTQPMDYEVYDVVSVEGSGGSDQGTQLFAPLYAAPQTRERHAGLAYFTTTRVPRVTAESQRRKGTRSTYIGTEVFLSIVDGSEAPWDPDLRQLAVKLRCTNRDLPLHLVLGQGATDFSLASAAPVASVRCVAGPTAPSASFVVDPDDPTRAGDIGWRLINHLALNYLSLTDSADGRGAEALRELLSLYAPVATATVRKQIDGVRSVSSRAVVRRIKGSGPLAFGRGIEIALTLDESAFAGSGAFLLGAVLDEFFARYVSINSFTETTVSTLERGELIRWPAKSGQRQVV
jgi:type VI secretion system protein ImpG